jgi:N-acetylglucosamine-6-sulfatase
MARGTPHQTQTRALLCVGGVLIGLGLWALVSTAPQSHGVPTAAGALRANVLFILADDMRSDGLQAMPNLQRLAQGGVTFDRYYATTPLCCPSRATYLTGLYARHHGVLTNSSPLGGVSRFDDRSTLATWAQAAGIRTGLIGRYLNGYESDYIPPGWDSWFGIWQSGEGYSNYFRYRVTTPEKVRYYGSEPDDYSTRVIGEQAGTFLSETADQPFLLVLAPRTPHGPATPDPLDSGAFKGVELPLAPSFNEEDVRDKPGYVKDRGRLSDDHREKLLTLKRLQLESLLSLDRMIEALVEQLRADGRLEHTWIVFASDNGLTLGEHRLGEVKMCPYEECARIPLVIVPPAGAAAQVPRIDTHLTANIDLAPTIAELLGVRPPTAVDGQSLVPLLADPNADWRDAVVLEQWSEEPDPDFVGIITQDRKYVRYRGRDRELYDLAQDPYELENLNGRRERQAEQLQLDERLTTLLARPSTPPLLGSSGAPR